MRAHSIARTPPTDLWERLAQPLESRVSEESNADAERIRRHLDATVPGGWELSVELQPVAETTRFVVKSRLTILGIAREDFGEGFSLTAASDDGLAKAARRFGIGSAEVAHIPPAIATAADHDHERERLATAFQTTEDDRAAAAPQSKRRRAVKPDRESRGRITISADEDFPSCPRCGDIMWDDRGAKKADDAPDFRCRRKGCVGTLWVDRTPADVSPATKSSATDSASSADEEFPF